MEKDLISANKKMIYKPLATLKIKVLFYNSKQLLKKSEHTLSKKPLKLQCKADLSKYSKIFTLKVTVRFY